MPPQKPAPHQVRQSTSEIRKTTSPTTIRITPTTCGSTLPPSVLTAQVRIAPKAIRIRLITTPIAGLCAPTREFEPCMRLGGFEPPTDGLEGRCSSTELQA